MVFFQLFLFFSIMSFIFIFSVILFLFFQLFRFLLVSCRPPMIAVDDRAQRDAISSASAFSVPKPRHYVPLASFFPFLVPSSPSPAATGLSGRPRFGLKV